jgi:hypothetical protein
MSVYLNCGSSEKKIMDISSAPEGRFSHCWKKHEGTVLLVSSVVFAALTVCIAYGLIPMASANPMYFAGIGTVLAILTFQMGMLRSCFQHCITVRPFEGDLSNEGRLNS